MAPFISAIVGTLNRAIYLRKALQSLANQTLPRERYEIIVVDNGSTDNTKQLVQDEFGYLSNLQYLYEPVTGLSRARNKGWQNSKGEYVAYLDDDAIASSNWLEKILESFDRVNPRLGGLGGKVEPIWESARPVWLSARLAPYLTILDWSTTPIILDNSQYLVGANMAFPTFLLREVGGFQVSLGRKGGNLLSNEEILLKHQLESLGYTLYYSPEIAVKHHVPASRLTQDWFIQRHYWQGVSKAILLLHQNSPSARKQVNLGMTEIKKLLKSPRLLLHLLTPSDTANDLEMKCVTFLRLGYILGLLIGRC